MYKTLMMILVLPLVLMACGDDGLEPADAESGLFAAMTGNLEGADSVLCESEMDYLRNEFDLTADYDIGVTCAQAESDMQCTFTVTAAGQSPVTVVQRFNVVDGKLCGEG